MKQTLKTHFGATEIYSAKSLDEHKNVMVVPGFCESIAHNTKLVDALSAKGYNTFTFSHPRKRGEQPITDPIVRQGEIALDALKSALPEGERVYALAHSLGAAAVLKAAQQSPERFEGIILMQPAGMVGADQGFTELVARAGNTIVKNQIGALRSQGPEKKIGDHYIASKDVESGVHHSGRVALAQLAASGVFSKNPVLAVEEAVAAGKYDIIDDITKVKKLGIPVSIVKAHNDELFNQAKVDNEYAKLAKLSVPISSVADPYARHNTFWLQPERTAQIASDIIGDKPTPER